MSAFDAWEFRAGMEVELEHGLHGPDTNVTDDDPHVTARIARAHLNEFPDYYTRLARMEQEATTYWEQRHNPALTRARNGSDRRLRRSEDRAAVTRALG